MSVLDFSRRIVYNILHTLSRGRFAFFNSQTGGIGEVHSRMRDVGAGPAQGQPQETRARGHALRVARVGPVRIRQLRRLRALHGAEPRMDAGARLCVQERSPKPRRVPLRVLGRGPRPVLGMPEERLGHPARQGEERQRVDRRQGAEALHEPRREDADSLNVQVCKCANGHRSVVSTSASFRRRRLALETGADR